MKRFLLPLIILIGIIIPNPTEAQESWEDLFQAVEAARQPTVTLDAVFVFADLLGEFGNVVDRGWGGNFGISIAPPAASHSSWSRYASLRVDVGYIEYGTETITICLVMPCRILTDMVTTNSILNLGVGPEFVLMTGPIRPYITGTVGTTLFSTDTSLQGIAWDETDGLFTTNHFQDWTFSWKTGAGVKVSVTPSISIDFGASYLNNGVAKWMAPGDIVDNWDINCAHADTGDSQCYRETNPAIAYRITEANLWMVHTGIEWTIFGRR